MFKSTALDAKESSAIIGGAYNGPISWDDYNKVGPYGECNRKFTGGSINAGIATNVTFGPWKRKGKSGQRKDGSYKDCNEK